jgi:hypothetical protein
MKKIQAAGGPQIRRQNQQQRRARTVRRRQEARRRRATHRLGPVAVRKGLRRREFLVGAAGAGAVLAAPSLLGGCHHDEEVKPGTIFFNLSHEDFSNKTYFLTGGGKTYRLTRVSDDPDVLERARRTNSFLRAVPKQQITHHVEGTEYATDSVSLLYLSSDIDKTQGTWSMSSVYVQLPKGSVSRAYQGARARTPSGPLPLSPKRAMYGIGPAQSEQDLGEELVVYDVNTQATAILGASPDLFSLDANSANHIQTNHINSDGDFRSLVRILQRPEFGPATPEESPGKTNAVGWGTLTPALDDSGQPLKNLKGTHAGRIEYIPVLHPAILGFAGQVVARITGAVKDDHTLGADVTGLKPKVTDPPNPALAGLMWNRQDGSSSVQSGIGGSLASTMTLKQVGPQNGLEISATVSGSPSQPQVSLVLDNWYVRFLGVYLQFLSSSGQVVPLAQIPEYVAGTIISGHDKTGDTTNEMFISVLGPLYTILGIPTWPGFITPTFNVPGSISTVRILASGIGSGSSNYPDTLLPGEFMTGVVSFGMTALLCAMGAAATVAPIMKSVVQFATPLAAELVVLLSADVNGQNSYSPAFWKAQGLALVKFLFKRDAGIYVKQLVDDIVPAAAEAIAEDSIPIAGWIMLGISIAVGVATLLETAIEVAESPWTYVNDLVFTHDLSVEILRDPGDGTFPENADHYIVTALFDDGTPHVQIQTLTGPVPATLPPVVFNSVPLGGQVNVSVAFYQEATGTTPGVLLGKGTTGLIANDGTGNPSITIEEVKYPINASTVYEHRQKTALDSAGNHVWNPNAPPPTVNASNLVCGTAGTLCNFQGITVRQGTGTQQGYVGYGWQSQSTDPAKGASCGTGLTGQFDQMANLNTGPDAQDGYLAGPCGFINPGVKLAYSLLSASTANFYLDTSNTNALHLRQVTLEPPGFAPPSSSNPQTPSPSWGVLNFMPDALVLHPAGHIVSISNANHKMETLKIPAAPMADADAVVHLLAQPKSGKGSRPGLMTSPVAAAVAPDGTILVLEFGDPTGNPVLPARIQAFDIGGNPKQFFTGANQASPYSLQLTATPNQAGWQYLDMAIEYGGFIYVLSHLEGMYRLDIYSPGQAGTDPISTTSGFNAANIAVDFWRNVYALNYEVIPMAGGGPPPFTEPSISLWAPSSSCVGAGCSA